MKWTNQYNFPKYVQEWLAHDTYDYIPGTFSATTLMQPPRQYALMSKHWDELTQDFADVIALRLGTAIHDSVEKVALTDCIQEERYKTMVAGSIITGKADIIKKYGETYQLIDVKSTSVWTVIYGSKDEEYIKQLSIYGFLGRRNGLNIDTHAQIWMIFTDWSKSKAQKDPEYPQTRIHIKDIQLWDDETTEKYIKERLNELLAARSMNQAGMPQCTPEELWETETTYAIKKEGVQRAVKVCKTEEEAIKYKDNMTNGAVHHIEKRPGEPKRCGYCPCTTICTQYADMKAEGRIKEE